MIWGGSCSPQDPPSRPFWVRSWLWRLLCRQASFTGPCPSPYEAIIHVKYFQLIAHRIINNCNFVIVLVQYVFRPMKAIVKVHSVTKEYSCDKIMSKICINKVNLRYRVVKRVVNKLCLCASLTAFRYKCIPL